MVKVGTTSNPGIISSIKVNTPAALPTCPLYNLVINQPAKGAHIISENSPINGAAKESIPMPSNNNPNNRVWYFLSLFFDILNIMNSPLAMQQGCQI